MAIYTPCREATCILTTTDKVQLNQLLCAEVKNHPRRDTITIEFP